LPPLPAMLDRGYRPVGVEGSQHASAGCLAFALLTTDGLALTRDS
jgi:hypothetical protein